MAPWKQKQKSSTADSHNAKRGCGKAVYSPTCWFTQNNEDKLVGDNRKLQEYTGGGAGWQKKIEQRKSQLETQVSETEENWKSQTKQDLTPGSILSLI